MQALISLDELGDRSLLQGIVSGIIIFNPDEEVQLLTDVSREGTASLYLIRRTPAGGETDEFYKRRYFGNKEPEGGNLFECLDAEDGYDFGIAEAAEGSFGELKSLAIYLEGVLFFFTEITSARKDAIRYLLGKHRKLNTRVAVPLIQIIPETLTQNQLRCFSSYSLGCHTI